MMTMDTIDSFDSFDSNLVSFEQALRHAVLNCSSQVSTLFPDPIDFSQVEISYRLAMASNIPVRLLMPLLKIIACDSQNHLNSIVSQYSSRDPRGIEIEVIVRLLSFYYLKDEKALPSLIGTLDRLKEEEINLHLLERNISKLFPDQQPLLDALTKVPFSQGSIILYSVASCSQKDILEASIKFLLDKSGNINPVTAVSLGKLLSKYTDDMVGALCGNTLLKLLLRNSSTTLSLIQNLLTGGTSSNFLFRGELGDAIWALAISDSDENRNRALSIICNSIEILGPFISERLGKISKVSLKAKRSLFMSLSGCKRLSECLDPILQKLITSETNEDLVYWLLLCLSKASLNYQKFIFSETLKQSKNTIRCSYVAAATSINSSEYSGSFVADLLKKKDLSLTENLCILLIGGNQIEAQYIRNACSHNGCLGERHISEVLLKYPKLPIHRILSCLGKVQDDEASQRYIFKAFLLAFNAQSHEQFEMAVRSLVSTRCFADCFIEAAKNEEISQRLINCYCKLICSSVKSESDLVNFLVVANTGRFLEVGLWSKLKRRVKLDNSGPINTVFEKIMTADNIHIYDAAISTFPGVVELIGSNILSCCSRILHNPPSEEDLLIFSTPSEQLPVVDVVTPIKKAHELALKKDPKKLSNITATTNSGLSKQEKVAYDNEVTRELQVKQNLESLKASIVKSSCLSDYVARYHPESMDKYLEDLGNAIFPLIETQEWLRKELCILVYSLSKSSQLRNFGPLAITSFLFIDWSSYIDRNWNCTDLNGWCEVMFKKLEFHKVLSHGSFNFILPVLLKLMQHSDKLNFNFEVSRSLIDVIANNATLQLTDAKVYETMGSLMKFIETTPSIAKSAHHCLHKIITHCQFDHNLDLVFLITHLQTSDITKRSFILNALEYLSSRYLTVLSESESLRIWILISCCDDSLSQQSQRVAILLFGTSEAYKENDYHMMLEILVDPQFDALISKSVIKATIEALRANSNANIFGEAFAMYNKLMASRFPEINSVRSSKLDLTVKSREQLVILLSETCKKVKEGYLSISIYNSKVVQIVDFFIKNLFFDSSEKVNETALNAAGNLINSVLSDKPLIDTLTQNCNSFLNGFNKNDSDADRVRVYVIIILAKLAEQFPVDDPRREGLIKTLFETLSTPSESVQNAVADSMISLFRVADHSLSLKYLEKFMDIIHNGKSLAERRGASYGLGSLIKARGSHILKEQGILVKLNKTLTEKGSSLESKQGALFALEMIAKYLGRNFEPYVVKLLDTLIGTFADGRNEIREATIDAASIMMSTVSSLGVNILLPVLLNLIESTSWRSKVGSIEWLGAMTSLAPRVLAKQLPIILPKLVEAMTDSHHNVQRTAREALHRYGNVVRNPEIRALSSIIMDALANPPQFTEKCLNAILHTAFAHVVDGPSLALLEPILTRALRDRGTGGTEVKKRAAQIVGNLATTLVDPKDLVLILNEIVPALVDCLSDPVPEVRSHCGKVLGMLVKTVGERPAPMKRLCEDLLNIIGAPFVTSVDRAGSAQALAEILAARGTDDVSSLLHGMIKDNLSSTKAYIREGFIMVVGFLPAAFDSSDKLAELYEAGMRTVISTSLGLLADENEAVREAATKANNNVIARFARIDHLAIFDVLVEALSDTRWRCRLGCLQLFQEFLSKFSSGESDPSMGIYSMPSLEELHAGGVDIERCHLLMSKAFIQRFDHNSSSIRHLSLTIWKGLASHPLRALASMLPILLQECCFVIDNLDDGHEIIFKALDDMLSKLGDRLLHIYLDRALELYETHSEVAALFLASVAGKALGSPTFPSVSNSLIDNCLPKFIQILRNGLSSPNKDTRNQSCGLFTCLVETTSKLNINNFVKDFIDPMLEELFFDPVIDPITLDGVLALLVTDEFVMVRTMDKALEIWQGASLVDVELADTVCEVITSIFNTVMAEGASRAVPILKSMINNPILPQLTAEKFESTCLAILSAIEADDDSPYQISLSQLLEGLYSDGLMDVAFRIIKIYCEIEGADLVRFYDIWPRRLLNERSSQAARDCLLKMIDTVLPRGQVILGDEIVSSLYNNSKLGADFNSIVSSLVKNLIIPLLTVSSGGLLSEEENRRNLACKLTLALANSVQTVTWGSSLTVLVGALIRTASDKKTTSATIFSALTDCVVAQVMLVKPFHPQLQRIFLSSLTVDSVRELAVKALIALMPCLSRPEPLVQELFTLAESSSMETKCSALQILEETKTCGDIPRVLQVAKVCIADQEVKIRQAAVSWIESIIDDPKLEDQRETLQSLLNFS